MASRKTLSRPAAARTVRARPGKVESAVNTSVKLPVHMKATLARLAKHEGMTTHGYMLRLLREGIDRNGKWREFIEDGRAALEEFDRTRLGYAHEDLVRYYDAKDQGKNPPPPKLRKWRS